MLLLEVLANGVAKIFMRIKRGVLADHFTKAGYGCLAIGIGAFILGLGALVIDQAMDQQPSDSVFNLLCVAEALGGIGVPLLLAGDYLKLNRKAQKEARSSCKKIGIAMAAGAALSYLVGPVGPLFGTTELNDSCYSTKLNAGTMALELTEDCKQLRPYKNTPNLN